MVAQAFCPSMRQRWNFTASAGTKFGGVDSLASPARILKRPCRVASGTPRKTWAEDPSFEYWKLKARVFSPANPLAEIIFSGLIEAKGSGASGFFFSVAFRLKTSMKAFTLTQP